MTDKINILVVDDEPIIIMSAERVLKAEGYNVEGALSGKEAMLKMGQNNYDLVLTDLNMLEVDGITLIKWIKQFRPEIGIVVITGYLFQETIKEALKLGIHDHMMKPLTPVVLKDVIHKAIEGIRPNASEHKPEKEFPASMFAELDNVIRQYSRGPGCTVPVIPVLLRAQEIFGCLPAVIQKRVALGLNIYPAEIHSIVSSHSGFRTGPGGGKAGSNSGTGERVWRGVICKTGKGINEYL
ncbi:MAG: response regulator [Nitrospirae bacterium]|nr:response regulator [Nitrospirota bacterium]